MRALVTFAAAVLLSSVAQAQNAAFPNATTLDALTTYPNFYHLKPIVVRGEVSAKDGQPRLVPAGGTGRGIELLVRGGNVPDDGASEVRGTFLDVGRMSADESNAAGGQLGELVRVRFGDRWPAHGELLVVHVSSAAPPPPSSPNPSLRQVALDPARYETQTLRLKGQFSGRNLLGDLPQAPRISRTDFVIRNAGGAVWVSGVAPRGKGWQLDLDSKLDIEQWLEVEGVVRHGGGLVWIQAKSVTETKAGVDDAADAQQPAPVGLPPAPPEVVFTLPAQDDTDVPPATTVKIQTSRDLDPATLEQHILVTYVGQASGAAALPAKPSFNRDNRVLLLTFPQPFERFRTVKVELLEGIKGTDGQPLKPFTLTFSVGG